MMHMADYSFATDGNPGNQKRVMWHVGTKDTVRPAAWDREAVGALLTPQEPLSDTWSPDQAKL